MAMSPALVIAAFLAAPLPAQPPEPATPAPVGEVVVTGRPTGGPTGADQVRAFAGAPAEVQLARWTDRVCPIVTGLDEAQNARMARGIAKVATSLGVKAQVGGCTPDLLVLITARPADLVEAMLKQRKRFFSRFVRDEQVRKALGGDRPVRWMLGAETRSSSGQYLQTFESALGEVESHEGHARNSRIASSFQQAIQAVIVVVDATRIDGMRIETVADYLAMAALAQVKPEQQFQGVDTVMNLFAPAPAKPVSGLTDWDRRYLATLYKLDPSAKASAQRSSLAGAVHR